MSALVEHPIGFSQLPQESWPSGDAQKLRDPIRSCARSGRLLAAPEVLTHERDFKDLVVVCICFDEFNKADLSSAQKLQIES
jgi:hypothetical protein